MSGQSGYDLYDDEEAVRMSKRELIEPHEGDKRFIRRDERGRIVESDDVARSLSQDVRRHASAAAEPGHGDHGDRSNTSKSS
jgi:hypothetical protein